MTIPYTKSSIEDVPQFLGPTEAARYLRIGRKTVYHWIHQGYFPHHRMGKLIKIRVSDLDTFLERTKVTPGVLLALHSGVSEQQPRAFNP